MKYVTYKGKIYKEKVDDYISAYEESNPFEEIKKLPFKWKGGRIPNELFLKINSFFMWTYSKWQAESQVRLFYNTKTKEWDAFPFPQEIRKGSMTTEDKNSNEIRSKFKEPWTYLGTAHHHCSTAAFQSGTDENNERNQDGFHYTIGKLNEKILDYHGRFSWNGTLFDLNPFELIECPKFALEAPKELQYEFAIKSLLLQPPVDNFPEEWKKSVSEKKYNNNVSYHPQYTQKHTNNYTWEKNHYPSFSDGNYTDDEIVVMLEDYWNISEAKDLLEKGDEDFLNELRGEINVLMTGNQSEDKILKEYKESIMAKYDSKCAELEQWMEKNNVTIDKIAEEMNTQFMGVEANKNSILQQMEDFNMEMDDLFMMT